MPKYRVFELAKEFETNSKVILDILAKNNISVRNHMSSIDEEGKQIIADVFAGKVENSLRVYQLAKHYNTTNLTILAILKKNDIPVSSPSDPVCEFGQAILSRHFNP